MPRPQRLDALYARLLEQKDLSLRSFKSEAQVFWLNGRSGVGKSVLLLQTVERLVTDGWRVLWLKGHAELLDPALRTIADVPVEWRPDFIAIDDIYDRDARERLDLGRLGEFIDECGHQTWPVILTCGPTEFADSFKEAATYRGFELYLDTVETIDTHETAEIEVWYCERTGKSVQRGTAFSQAAQEDNGLFVSLALELAHGDLNVFAQRFGKRIQLNDLDKALWLPLALNRLYLRAPYDWLTEQDREKLATLNSDGDFSLLDASEEGQIVRLTHPHLANALYLALRKPANSEAYTNDLVAVFQRAITECNTGLVSQLLRLFSGREQGLAIERLSILNFPSLAQKCARAWVNEHVQRAFDADGLVDVATSWACWATKIPSLNQALGLELWTMALRLLESAYKAWPTCWLHLARFQPKHGELFSWAAEHLANPLRIRHPRWSFVWECCVQNDAARQEIWHTMGLEWLQQHLWRPDWHIVWKRLLPANDEPDWKNDPVLILGRRRLYAESDGPDWAFVLQDLYALAAPHSPQARELADLARAWLNGREDRAEWAHVWQVLLKQCDALPETLPLSELLHLGAQWLVGREDRAEWAHVWQVLLEQCDALPETLSLSELLRLGAQWLVGREDRAEWMYVWRALLEQRNVLPETLPLSELLHLGAQWLAEREDRTEWTYVWQALLEQCDVLPETLPLSELLHLGAQWLAEREDRTEWTYVWQALLEQCDVLPETLPLSKLLHLGAQWLVGREDRAEWAHIWQGLLKNHDVLPEELPLSKLLHLGAQWLVGREDRAEWAHIWQGLLKNHDVLPEELPLSKLLHLGAQWLVGREDRAEWAHIWQDLLKNHDVLPEELPLHELLHLGARWLAGHDETEEWGFICERLLEQQFQAADFFEDAASWLNRSRKKPEWPLLAAKFIVVAPQHAASAELAAILIQQIKKCPNNAHWFKTVSLVANLSADSNLPQEVHDWLRVLNSRKELPAWTEARRCLDEGLPLKGRVTVPKEKHSSGIQIISATLMDEWREVANC